MWHFFLLIQTCWWYCRMLKQLFLYYLTSEANWHLWVLDTLDNFLWALNSTQKLPCIIKNVIIDGRICKPFKEVLTLRNKHVSISSYLFKIDVLHHVIYRLWISTDAATIFVIGLILLFHSILQQVFCKRCEFVLVRNLMLMITAFLIWCNQI